LSVAVESVSGLLFMAASLCGIIKLLQKFFLSALLDFSLD